MRAPLTQTWPIPDTQAVAATQTLVAAGGLTLNGVRALGGRVNFPGFTRAISLTSANNLGGVNFTITGTVNGTTQTVVLAGPNNNTVQTNVFFDSVTSITTDNAAAAVSAGTGTTGRTRWLNSNTFAPTANMAVQVVVSGTITYSFIATLQPVSARTDAMITTFTPIAALTAQNGSAQGIYAGAVLYTAVRITASNADGALTAYFLQQGTL